MWTFKQVYDKLTEEYIHGKVEPFDPCFCFVGNLLGQKGTWACCRSYSPEQTVGVLARKINIPEDMSPSSAHWLKESNDHIDKAIEFIESESGGTYTPIEIADVEAIFMYTYYKNGGRPKEEDEYNIRGYKKAVVNEEALWKAFVAGLEKLKEVHISKGENVEEEVKLKRRELVCADL